MCDGQVRLSGDEKIRMREKHLYLDFEAEGGGGGDPGGRPPSD